MRADKLRKIISLARSNVQADISGHANSGGKYAHGLASEGYAGGYAAALDDVLLLVNDSWPCVRPDYWEKRHD